MRHVARVLELLQRTETSTAALFVGPRLPDAPFAQMEAVVDLQAIGLNTIVVERWDDPDRRPDDAAIFGGVAGVGFVANGIVAHAAALAAHFGLRNLATVAGAIDGATANPPGPPELLLALLVLGARVTMLGDESESLATYRPSSHTILQEVVAHRYATWHGALARVARSPLDQAIVTAVAAVSPTLPASPLRALRQDRSWRRQKWTQTQPRPFPC